MNNQVGKRKTGLVSLDDHLPSTHTGRCTLERTCTIVDVAVRTVIDGCSRPAVGVVYSATRRLTKRSRARRCFVVGAGTHRCCQLVATIFLVIYQLKLHLHRCSGCSCRGSLLLLILDFFALLNNKVPNVLVIAELEHGFIVVRLGVHVGALFEQNLNRSLLKQVQEPV